MRAIDLITVVAFLCFLLGVCSGLLFLVYGATILQALGCMLIVTIALIVLSILPILILCWILYISNKIQTSVLFHGIILLQKRERKDSI